MEQHSEEWFAARRGKITASRIADVCARTRTGWGASRSNYAAELICERLTDTTAGRFTNAAMQWGTDTEPQARAAYEFLTDNTVELVGFVDHPIIAMTGASPDGLIGSDGMLEIKCPNTATHINTLISETVDGKYMKQMQWQMACAKRAWCDFVSFDPRMPEEMQLWQYRVIRDDDMIFEIAKDVQSLLIEIDETIAKLRAKYTAELKSTEDSAA